jgi:hypothetical protein
VRPRGTASRKDASFLSQVEISARADAMVWILSLPLRLETKQETFLNKL